jgi:hypothetical protein
MLIVISNHQHTKDPVTYQEYVKGEMKMVTLTDQHMQTLQRRTESVLLKPKPKDIHWIVEFMLLRFFLIFGAEPAERKSGTNILFNELGNSAPSVLLVITALNAAAEARCSDQAHSDSTQKLSELFL